MIRQAIPFFTPSVGRPEADQVAQVLASGWLANGPRAALFEDRLADLVGAPAALATASGTAGLYVALQALGIGPGDEVITTPVTCIASVNAVALTGATPVLADVLPDTLNLDPARVAEAVTPRTAAIMPVHYAGVPADVDGIAAVARRHGLPVVEDAAHALGASHRGRPIGSTADLTVFSFSATKIITTGEGGLVAGRPDLVAKARTLANLGADRAARHPTLTRPVSWADVTQPGHKFAMSDVSAAIGLAQLDRLPGLLAERRALADRYQRILAGRPGLRLPVVPAGSVPSWHLYTLRIDPEVLGFDRAQYLHRLVAAGGVAALQFKPAHREPYLREMFPGLHLRLPVAERESDRNLSLPLYPGLPGTALETVAAAAIEAAGQPSHHEEETPR